jgi:hypothetical protein
MFFAYIYLLITKKQKFMKKFFFMGIGIALTCIVFYACDVTKQLQDVNKAGYICSNYAFQPPNEMDKKNVVDMVRNYYQNQYKILHNQSGNRLKLPKQIEFDSRAVFFNLDTLEKMIYFIRQASISYSKEEKQNLGVNIYFAAYPEDLSRMKFGHDYTNRHTLVFIPSLFNPTTYMPVDINILPNLQRKSERPIPILSDFYTSGGIMFGAAEKSLKNTNDPTGMTSQNNGTGTPPPPPSGGTINGTTGNPLLDITSQ